jgi:hypothetical protein
MRKMFLVLLFSISCFAAPINITQADVSVTYPIGTKKPIAVNLASTDYVVAVHTRLITATAGTVIYVDIQGIDGKATNVPIPPNMPIINVTKIYKTGTDCTNILIWPLE